MERKKNIRLGVVPVKRGPDFTSSENALISKKNAFEAMEAIGGRGAGTNMEFVNIDTVVENGIASRPEEISKITGFLKKSAVDAVFMLHCDFGLEEIVARVGKELGKPLLLWGARDDGPDPVTRVRIRDTQCGIFASSKVLQRYGVPFTYIENCRAKDKGFKDGLGDFCRAASVVKAFRSMRILLVGSRPKDFLSVMVNEDELLNRFGIETVPVNMGEFYEEVMDTAARSGPELKAEVERLRGRIDCSAFSEEKLKKLAAMITFIKNRMERLDCSGTAIECWSSTLQLFDMLPCQAVGELTDLGFPAACEADVCGAVTSVMLQAAQYNEIPTFFADLTIRHPNNDNAELLWHCGPFPSSLCDTGCKPRLDAVGRGQWMLGKGDITIARFDGTNGKYSMFMGEGRATDGPGTEGTYTWFETDNWPMWERMLVEGPYIHHVSGIYGRYANILQEACKYIPGVSVDRA